tara:strand:+ start:4189 stop:4959 length:771 start_codon:yes stop_codon:yes gene_type:complete
MVNFSVIIPTHNRNIFLNRAIKSTLKQKKKPIEILVIDDCNNSETKKTVKEFTGRHKNTSIKYLKNKISNNALISRNFGAANAKGNYIAFLDDDDFWHKNYLFDASKNIKKRGVDIIIYHTLNFFSKKKIKSNKKIPLIFNIEDYLHYNPGVVCSNVIIKKKIFLDLKGYDYKISGGADKDLFIRGILLKKSYFISNKKYVYLQNHPNQWSKKHKLILLQKILFFKKYFKYYLDFKNFFKFIKMIIVFMLFIIKRK